MRWGVRDEATDDHQTMTICRDEVRFLRMLLKFTKTHVNYNRLSFFNKVYYPMYSSCGFVKKLQ